MLVKNLMIGAAIIYTKERAGDFWFLCKNNSDSDWELPKAIVRRGESSVRSVIRIMSEQGGMRARVIEEIGRASSTTSVNNRLVPQKTIYYLMLQKGEDNVIGFAQYEWFPFEKALRRLSSKKDQAMLKAAKQMVKELARRLKAKGLKLTR